MKNLLILFLSILTTLVSAQNKDIQFIETEHIETHKTDWVKEGKHKASFKIKFRGGCCDMPSIELMNGEIANDTLYIDKAVENHKNHDEIGICGITVKVIINSKKYPDYRNLVINFKELPTTKKRRVPHIKN